MTVQILIGRRRPKHWFKRQAARAAGLLSFSENIWLIINQSINMAKKKANASNTGIKYVTLKKVEPEDLRYEIEWLKVMVQGNREQEEDEYRQAMKLYTNIGEHFNKEIPKDGEMAKVFKTKMLNINQVKEAYEEGYGCMMDKSMASKMLEMGILTHIEWLEDFNERIVEM